MARFKVKNIDASSRTIGAQDIPASATATVSETDWYAASPTVRGYFTLLEGEGSAPTVTSVASSATTVTLVQPNASRNRLFIHNASTALLYVKLGAVASTSDFTWVIAANGGQMEVPADYKGRIDGIWASANGAAKITEIV